VRISFDLDGVIADGHHWFFSILEPIRGIDRERAEYAELEYYSSRPLKYHPHLFLASDDEAIIVTARKPKAQAVTCAWLKMYGINLPTYFVDPDDCINWGSYDEAAKESARLKSIVIKEQRIAVHFDNSPILVATLRKILPGVRVILVGGEMS